MTSAARKLIRTFETLAEEDQQEVLVELLQVPIGTDDSAPSDEELRHTADQIFLGYDEQESQD